MSPLEEELAARLAAEQLSMTLRQDAGFKRLRALLRQAFEARESGDLPLSQRYLNTALDAEYELTGECELLGDLAEAWGVDDETESFPQDCN